MKPFRNTKGSRHGHNMEASTCHTLYYICCTELQTIFVVEQKNHSHRYMLKFRAYPFVDHLNHCFHVVHMHCCWGQVMRVVNYAHSVWNEFKSQSFTLWYNAFPLTTFDYAFHKSSTIPNPFMNFAYSHKL